MVHLRTVPDAWQARVLVARLGCEGIVTDMQGNLSGPYPFGAVSVLVEADQAELASALLLADEVEASFPVAADPRPLSRGLGDDRAEPGDYSFEPGDSHSERTTSDGPWSGLAPEGSDLELDLGPVRVHGPWQRWRRAIAAGAIVVVAAAPVLAHFAGQ